jgi:hypothetical protein
VLTLEERFWPKVNQTSGCWLWTSATNGRYGLIGRGRRGEGMAYAHRVAWELTHGPIPDGMDVCHACDTPLCVRPDHLFLGTRADNMADCKNKGRWNKGSRGSPGERNGRCKVTDAQVVQLQELRAAGWTYESLAEHIGIGPTQAARLARNQRSVI